MCYLWQLVLYMDIETTSCGHLYHPNRLHIHLQESTSCKKCGQFLHPLWFENKGIKCVEEYEKKKVALGLDVEMNMWLEHCRSTAIRPSEPT
jgi:hypothetical protein